MSLDELISITNKAVNSLVKSDSDGQQRSHDLGSPFDSPRSFRTSSDINESQNHSDTSHRLNASKSKTSDHADKSTSPLNQSLNSSKGKGKKNKDTDLTAFDHSDNVTVIEIISLAEKVVNGDINTNCSHGNEKEGNFQNHTENVSTSKDVTDNLIRELKNSSAKKDEKVIMTTSAAGSDDFFRQYLGRKTDSEAFSSRPGAKEAVSVESAKHKVYDDVHISHFGLTEKQRDLKQALAK
ncbi:hypothetical protein Btru_034967, partial [Bulinus truncatus]